MALKDIFNMAKAARYTQDGRDQITEALENETEDVRYKPGDISQKTGLQKQPDGSWAEPKQRGKITPKGKALMEKAAKNPRLTPHGREAAAKLAKQYGEELAGSVPKFGKGSGTESDPDKEGSIAWYANQAKKKPEAPAETNGNDLHKKLTSLKPSSPELKNDFEDHRDIILKRVSRGEETFNEAMSNYEKEMRASVPRMVENEIMSPEEGQNYIKAFEDLKKQIGGESAPSESAPKAPNSAPRQLTGDCKIKIKKS